MSLVTVICPGARRCSIKVTPNTVLLQVLEQACSKQRLDPTLYAIKHHGKLLDLSLPLRYSGVPNNGKLELVTADKQRTEGGDVVVAIQTADGKRIQSTFHSSTSLWNVLIQHKLDSSAEGMEPSLAYMRQEVCGEEALKSKTLRAIGLSSGRGLLRLTHRKPSTAEVGENTAVSGRKQDDGFPTAAVEQSCEALSNGPGGRGEEKETQEEKTEGEEGGEMEVEVGGEEGGEGGAETAAQSVREEEPRMKPPHSGTVTLAMDTTEEQLPYFPAHPISYFSNPNDGDIEKSSGEIEETLETDNTALSIPPMLLDAPSSTAASLIPETLQQHSHSPYLPPEVVAAQMEEVLSSPFAQFAGLLRPHPLTSTIFPPQPKVYDEPCERELVVYHLDDSLPLTPTDVSDAFFEHTVTDIQVMHSDLKRRAKTSDAPLMTRAMRAVRDEMKLEKYKKSTVRVYFPDRWVLQGCFRPRESLKMLVTFIREHLADPQDKFYLYTTPPRNVLKSARITFAEAGFLPTAVVYVGVDEDKPHPQLSHPTLQRAMSALHAEIVHTRHRTPSEENSSSQSSGCSSDQPQSHPRPKQLASAATATSQQAGRRVPKWFKPGH